MLKFRFTNALLLGSSIGLVFGLSNQMVNAAGQLPITSPPVVNGGNTGPLNDPSASKGQWFENVTGFNGNAPIVGNTLTNRVYEFYDNKTGNGGGSANTDAITGKILPGSLTFDGNNLVTGFTIRATITNDYPPQGTSASGTNSHGETRSASGSGSVAKLHDIKLTTEFADDGVQGNFPTGGSPYLSPESNIFAKNYDELAWYSYTTTGKFQVPTWDFGNLLVGQSTFRDLQFGLYTSVSQATIQFLIDANDVFMNRTTDLKIGDYFENGTGNVNVSNVRYEGLAVDDGTAYPSTLSRSGNVSVFTSIPEPGSLSLMILGLASLASATRRKNR